LEVEAVLDDQVVEVQAAGGRDYEYHPDDCAVYQTLNHGDHVELEVGEEAFRARATCAW